MQPERALYCLEVADHVLVEYTRLDQPARRAEGGAVLAKGLSYALSVYVAPIPQPGFAFLERWARTADPGVQRIVRANLGKARLAKSYPGEVAVVLGLLDSPADPLPVAVDA